jgi:hypothetical protein
MPVVYKADEGKAEFHTIVKAADNFDERGELLAVVYAPETVDKQGDIASAEVIRDMAHEFQRSGGQIDMRHDLKPVSKAQAFVAENFIIQKGDERFNDFKDYDGKLVNVVGGWGVMIKVEDPALRKLYRDGGWNGVSMYGPAEFEPVAAAKDDAGSFMSSLGDFLRKAAALFAPTAPTPDEDEFDMKKEDLQAVLTEANKPVLGALNNLVKALKGTKPAPKTKTPPAKGKGKPKAEKEDDEPELDEADEVEKDEDEPEADESDEVEKDEDDETEVEEAPEEETAKEELERLRKENLVFKNRLKKSGRRTNQPAEPVLTGKRLSLPVSGANLTKQETSDFERGVLLAERWNKSTGRS